MHTKYFVECDACDHVACRNCIHMGESIPLEVCCCCFEAFGHDWQRIRIHVANKDIADNEAAVYPNDFVQRLTQHRRSVHRPSQRGLPGSPSTSAQYITHISGSPHPPATYKCCSCQLVSTYTNFEQCDGCGHLACVHCMTGPIVEDELEWYYCPHCCEVICNLTSTENSGKNAVKKEYLRAKRENYTPPPPQDDEGGQRKLRLQVPNEGGPTTRRQLGTMPRMRRRLLAHAHTRTHSVRLLLLRGRTGSGQSRLTKPQQAELSK